MGINIELAPMEGITTYIYRNALNKYYGGIDRYYTPFISTHKDKELNFKEKNEIRPENNEGLNLIPQILTNNADEFLYTSGQIKRFGYDYVNLNFGCPSATVTTKTKGAGILRELNIIENLLDEIFMKSDMKISVKTRLGYDSDEEWDKLVEIYNKFPLEELIVHCRVREDFYKGKARIKVLKDSVDKAENKQVLIDKLCYNGDIYSVNDFDEKVDIIPELSACMIGRGIISNPMLAKSIKESIRGDINIRCGESENMCKSESGALSDLDTFKSFNYELITKYNEIMPGEKNTLFKLKELWTYMNSMFPENLKILKSVQKVKNLKEYEFIINSIDQYL